MGINQFERVERNREEAETIVNGWKPITNCNKPGCLPEEPPSRQRRSKYQANFAAPEKPMPRKTHTKTPTPKIL